MATAKSGTSWSETFYTANKGGSNSSYYRWVFTGALNSVNLTNKTANVTITLTAGSLYGGYAQWRSEQVNVHVQKGSTVCNSKTTYYVATIGRGNSSTSNTYYDRAQTVSSAGGTDYTEYSDGKFFTWTGDVAYDISGSTGSLVLSIYHTVVTPSSYSSYLPASVSKTERVTWTVPNIYYMTYSGNGGTPSKTGEWQRAGYTVTLPTATRANSTGTSALTHTFNTNGGNTPSPSTKTTTKTTTTYYTFNKWWSGSTSYAASATYTVNAGTTLTAC